LPAIQFGNILANLLALRATRRAKIRLIVGAGISNLTRIRHPNKIISGAPHNACVTCAHVDSSDYSEQRAIWSEFEYNRMYSRNVLPELSFYFLSELCKQKIVKSIITTNYDSTFLTIFERDPSLPPVILNPLLTSNDMHSHAGFRVTDKPKKTDVPIYFIHGHFEWARFNQCGCLVKLPRWVVGSNLWKVPANWKASIFHDFDPRNGHLNTGYAQHYIDWNVGRDHFETEIRAAKAQIKKAIRYNGVLLILGFLGRNCSRLPTWHEEIAVDIAGAASCIPTFMVITEQQESDSRVDTPDGPTSSEKRWLLEQLQRGSYSRVDVVENFDDWLIEAFEASGQDALAIARDYQYRWLHSRLFLTAVEFEGT
jgi:hypothetical protein